MSFWGSIFLFNPMESMIILIYLNVFSKSKNIFKINLYHLFSMSTVLFGFQYGLYKMGASLFSLILNILSFVVIYPIIILIFSYIFKSRHIIKSTLKREIKMTYICYMFVLVTMFMSILVLNIFIKNINFSTGNNIHVELITNIFIRIVQILLLPLCKEVVNNERIFKKGVKIVK